FHAGTSENEKDQLVTAGGRVLVPTASSNESVQEARTKAFEIAQGIEFEGARYRSDIAVGAD
ncbi:MAG: phosphoribosylamine--glycine ligase, partial [Chloroflexi bacterium]|nr:phosphoribosylamine--glycine ligase [Chloroflexota bacterium]